MRLYVSRDSVCAGDDTDAPHARVFDVPGTPDVAGAVEHVLASGYLPSIAGGLATWSIVSAIPVAVVAQQWPKPRHFMVAGLRHVDYVADTLRLHFNYHAQIDPETVRNVLWGMRLHAI